MTRIPWSFVMSVRFYIVDRAGGAGAEGAEISAPLFSRLDTIFLTASLFVGVINHRIHLRHSFLVNERDYVIHQAFAASSKLLPLLLLANFYTQPTSCLWQIVHNNTDYRKVRIMHQSMPACSFKEVWIPRNLLYLRDNNCMRSLIISSC